MSPTSLIIGAGGHGKVIADLLLQANIKVLGFVDDNSAMIGKTVLGFPVLGQIERWQDYNPDYLILGIGNNQTRRSIIAQIEQYNPEPPWIRAVHPRAIIAHAVTMAVGTVVMAGAVINVDTMIGQHTIINTGATVDHDCVIGDFVHIAPGAHLSGGVRVSDGVLLGVGCAVLPGCEIKEGAVIGGGAVVVDNIPPGVVARGVPARWDQ